MFKKVSGESLIKKSVQKIPGLYVYIFEMAIDIDRLMLVCEEGINMFKVEFVVMVSDISP